ncbi:MAG: metallophosphoesterase family protein [Candidatus Limnocylindrales bacterium]
MRVAVVSDIHANLAALDAVLDALAPYDEVWQLGDIVGYGPQPDEVVARLREIGATGVRGNHDAAAIGALSTEAFNDDARAAIEWTADHITDETRAWLTGLETVVTAGEFTLVHGSPRDPVWEYMVSGSVARSNLSHFETPWCLVGHTHIAVAFRQAGSRVEAISPSERGPLKLDERRAIINPGSVGQPRDGDPRAGGMLLDTELNTVEWHRVGYPVEVVQGLMEERGLPARLIERLAFGW